MRFTTKDRSESGRSFGAISILLLIVGFVAAGSAIRDYNSRAWQGRGRFSVLDLQSKVLKSIDPITEEGVRLVLPGELVINTLDGRGRWSIEAIEEKKTGYGVDWAVESIGDYLGVMGVVSVEKMTFFDRLRWWTLDRSARYRDVQLDKTAFVANSKAIDEADVLGLGAIWEASVREYFVSFELANEKLSLSVVNTTKTPGLAGRVARMLDVVGISVERVESVGELAVNDCLLTTTQEQTKLVSISFIRQIWNCEIQVKEGNKTTLYLGNKFAERYKQSD